MVQTNYWSIVRNVISIRNYRPIVHLNHDLNRCFFECRLVSWAYYIAVRYYLQVNSISLLALRRQHGERTGCRSTTARSDPTLGERHGVHQRHTVHVRCAIRYIPRATNVSGRRSVRRTSRHARRLISAGRIDDEGIVE
jgi:hypothetical protein